MSRAFLTVVATFFLSLVLFTATNGQELEIDVTVDRSQVNNTSLNFLDELPREIETYLNDHDWIEANFREMERITGEMQIVLLSVDYNFNFQANIVVRTQRPIYNTLRQTTVFLYNDNSWAFNYTPNRSLIHDELQFDGITTLLDFYAYIILGYDFDSFSELGGTSYFTQAQNLVALAQTTASTGWSRTSGTRRNRAQLIADLLNPSYEGLRRANYIYHRQGLDRFTSDAEEARRRVIEALRLIRDSRRTATDDALFDIFFNAKYREIVSIFEDAPPSVRLEAYNLLADIDQSHLSVYEKLQ
ncbi:MAG: DUF4835 family protein [Balneolaceae bacterium]|nr:DUF4835 family protein [Balneolaceae bacterium]